MSIVSFTANAYDSGVRLQWDPGFGSATSTISDLVEITIQYSTTITHNVIPNTPPYVVRELQQPQGTENVFYHPYLINGTTYTYSIFVHYMDTGYWEGPSITTPVICTAGDIPPLVSGSISFSKLGANTVLMDNKNSGTTLVVWLSDDQHLRKQFLEQSIIDLKPAHSNVTISYENYYVAHTTTEQFQSGSYASGVYTIENGVIMNSVPTIDNSFSGIRSIYGG